MEIRNITAKNIKGFSTRTDNATEMAPDKGKIPALWKHFDDTVFVDYQNGERVFGVYFNYESDHKGQFDVLAGFDGQTSGLEKGLEEVTIQAGRYLVFSKQGDMPQIAIDAWTEVWQYFSSNTAEYIRLYSTDFEYYPSGDQIEVHIAVR